MQADLLAHDFGLYGIAHNPDDDAGDQQADAKRNIAKRDTDYPPGNQYRAAADIGKYVKYRNQQCEQHGVVEFQDGKRKQQFAKGNAHNQPVGAYEFADCAADKVAHEHIFGVIARR